MGDRSNREARGRNNEKVDEMSEGQEAKSELSESVRSGRSKREEGREEKIIRTGCEGARVSHMTKQKGRWQVHQAAYRGTYCEKRGKKQMGEGRVRYRTGGKGGWKGVRTGSSMNRWQRRKQR